MPSLSLLRLLYTHQALSLPLSLQAWMAALLPLLSGHHCTLCGGSSHMHQGEPEKHQNGPDKHLQGISVDGCRASVKHIAR